MWNIQDAWFDSFTDIAVLKLEPFSEGCASYSWKKLGMTARLPRVGSEVSAFRYHSPLIEQISDSSSGLELFIRNDPTTSDGTVLQACESSAVKVVAIV